MSLNYIKKEIKALLSAIEPHIQINNIGDLGYSDLKAVQKHLTIVLNIVKGV